jgi:AcrR family transcriptional regulator
MGMHHAWARHVDVVTGSIERSHPGIPTQCAATANVSFVTLGGTEPLTAFPERRTHFLMALGSPVRDRRAERHQATRAEILEAAWALVRKEGLAGLSLRDLAATVGMQPPSIYSYFESKHAIYDAMFRQGYEELNSRTILFEPEPGPAAFKARLRSLIYFCTEDPARYQLLFQRTLPGFTPSPESYALAMNALEGTYRALAADGITSPEHRDLFTALVSGLADQQMANDPGGDRWVRLTDHAADMFLAYATNATLKRGRKS